MNLEAILIFIDFKKAFDTIHRGKILTILKAYGIPEELVTAISMMYEDTLAKVITPDGETFNILAGVLQGDTLAPYLFVIVIDYVMRTALQGRENKLGFQLRKRKSRRVQHITVTYMDFADDIALVSEGIKETQEMLTRVEKSAKRVGLSMNTGKTKYMSYNTIQQFEIKAIDGSNLKRVEDFKCLGAWLDSSAKDLKIRKVPAWRTCHQMRNIWKSTLSRKMKLSLMHTIVESVLLYRCETWNLTKILLKQLDGTYTRILRMILNVHWYQKVTNEVLYGAIEKISIKIRRRFLKFAGHCLRRDDEVFSDLVLCEPTHGTR